MSGTKAHYDASSGTYRDSHGTVINFNPVDAITRRRNEFSVPKSFPFQWRSLPTVQIAMQEIILATTGVVVSCASLVLTIGLFLPMGIVKSVANIFTKKRKTGKRCVIMTGASSGIGAALVEEYAAKDTHIVLIGRDKNRLSLAAEEAKGKGATAEYHMIDFHDQDAIQMVKELIFKTDKRFGGISIAIQASSVVGHQADVLGKEEDVNEHVSEDIKYAVQEMESGALFGATTAQRVMEVNVEVAQAFIMTVWETMKCRPDGKEKKIVIIASSAAWFGPANFCLYSSSKAYLYMFAQSLRVLSQPFSIQITTICPGFIESGMTSDMMAVGSTTPRFVYANSKKLAHRIKRAEEDGQAVLTYPLVQTAFLFGLKGLTPLGEALGMWISYAMGIAGWITS